MVVSASTGEAPKTWLLSGIPRSGSSLCCRLAAGLPDFVALSEPIAREASSKAETADAACDLIAAFVAQTRARALSAGRVPTIHVDGRLDEDRVARAPNGDTLRERRGERGEVEVGASLSPAFGLLVKHNALFAALMAELPLRFPCLAIVRNPVAVLASWRTVDLPVGRGRVPAAEQFDGELRRALDREHDVLRRQIAVLNWFYRQYRTHLSAAAVIRYEDLVASDGATLYRALGHAAPAPERLVSRNANPVYDQADVETVLSAVLDADRAWAPFYDEADCVAVAQAIRSGHGG